MKKVIKTVKLYGGGKIRNKRLARRRSKSKKKNTIESFSTEKRESMIERSTNRIGKLTEKQQKKQKKTQKLEETIAKKKGFWGNLKNLLTFKQSRKNGQKISSKQTGKKLKQAEILKNTTTEVQAKVNRTEALKAEANAAALREQKEVEKEAQTKADRQATLDFQNKYLSLLEKQINGNKSKLTMPLNSSYI